MMLRQPVRDLTYKGAKSYKLIFSLKDKRRNFAHLQTLFLMEEGFFY
jgi:hypothetical protein